MSLLGAILAGGGSRRFRSPKTLARLHGTPLWRVAAERLRSVCDDVVAIVNHPQVAHAVELETLPDRRPLLGPLGGIDAALARAVRGGHDAVLVLAVDMPWVGTDALRQLVDAWRKRGLTTLPRAGPPWGFHPLCGIYPLGVLTPLNSAFAERRLKSGAFANSLDPQVVDTGLLQWDFRSVNHPGDLPPR
jgi:molybdopterin-guanine dinucleotide biosynthesis protein A